MFKLEDYETVAMLNRWFIENYPMGRTNIEIIYHDPKEGFITCRAEVYRDINDAHPAVTNIAHGSRDLYNSNMRRFYAEDIASSSLGRAITLLKGGQTATRDDMEKVDTNKSFDKRLAVIEENSQKSLDYTRDIKIDLKNDVRRLDDVVSDVERTAKSSQRETDNSVRDLRTEVRSIRGDMEVTLKSNNRELQSTVSELKRENQALERKLENKIKQALDNPLANK